MKLSTTGLGQRLGRLPAIWIISIPIVIGILFRAATSAHGDAIMYRMLARSVVLEGTVPIQPWEWAHPGHYIVIAPFLALQMALGYGDDPLFLCQLLAFVLHGLLAWTMVLCIRALLPERSPAPALALGLAVATIPGWLWCSQMPLSDVSGNALILLAAARFVLHEARARDGGEAFASVGGEAGVLAAYLFTGLVIGLALLFRLSSLAMGPLFVFLGLRILAATPRSRRLPKGLAVIAGTLLPALLLYLHWISRLGWDSFLAIHLRSGGDNASFKAGLGELWTRWSGHWLNGLGPVLLWAGAAGLVLALVSSARAGHRHPLRSRSMLLVLGVLAIVPYLLAVARNQAWFEFRYQVPALVAITLGVIAPALVVERLAGGRVVLVLGLAVTAANLAHALPLLEVFAGRQSFTETGARALAERSPKGAVIPAHYAHPYIDYLCPGRRWLPVHAAEEFGLSHHSFLPPSLAADQCLAEYREGRELWIMNDPTIHGFRLLLREQGWREELVWSRPFDGLRHWRDPMLADMSLEEALEPCPLRLFRLHPPDDAEPVLTHSLVLVGEPEGAVEVRIHAPPLAGWNFRLLFGTRLVEAPQKQMHWIRLPFDQGDPLLAASSSDAIVQKAGLDSLEGRIDGAGEARLLIPGGLRAHLAGSWSTVLFFEPGHWFHEARLRTRALPFPPPPGPADGGKKSTGTGGR